MQLRPGGLLTARPWRSVSRDPRDGSMNTEWWADAVYYEVYPRSFADASGDGVGDLPGITARLPYLADLGVDAIWLAPFYPSPLADGGYDVGDYTDVDPRLGTLADFDALVSAAAARGIRVLVDLVPNHCSASHPAFRAALAAGSGSAERDLFIFRDGRGADGELAPNNWRSAFGGLPDPGDRGGRSARQWYLHLFDASQPDWNWRDPDVPAFFAKVIRFWLDRGAAGLRVDVANGLYKDPALPDTAPAGTAETDRDPCYHRPELQDLYRSWRAVLDSYPAAGFPGQRTAIGEVWYGNPHSAARTLRPYLTPGGLRQVFNFQLLLTRWDAAALREAIEATLAVADGSRTPWILGSHDATRPVTRARRPSPWPAVPPTSLTSRPGQGGPARPRCCSSRCPDQYASTRARNSGSPRCSTCRTPRGPTPRSTAAVARSRAVTAAASRCPGRVLSRRSASLSRLPCRGLPQPKDWVKYTAEAQHDDPASFLNLYRAALRLRRELPARGTGRWSGSSVRRPCPP